MNNPATEYFISESIAHARSLPVPQAVLFLQGLLQIDPDSLYEIRAAYVSLSNSDKQLELIQSAQLRLKLADGEKSKPDGGKAA